MGIGGSQGRVSPAPAPQGGLCGSLHPSAPIRTNQRPPQGWEGQSPAPRASVAPQAFNVVFEKAIQKTPPADEVKQRVINLTDEITYSVYMYTARGLFERDKLIFLAQVTFQVTSSLAA